MRLMLDDRRLIASQIDQTVRELHGRGMVASLIFRWETGEAGTAVGRLGQWTAILDELARELQYPLCRRGGQLHSRTCERSCGRTPYGVSRVSGRRTEPDLRTGHCRECLDCRCRCARGCGPQSRPGLRERASDCRYGGAGALHLRGTRCGTRSQARAVRRRREHAL